MVISAQDGLLDSIKEFQHSSSGKAAAPPAEAGSFPKVRGNAALKRRSTGTLAGLKEFEH